MIWFTSDLHFGHKKVIEYGNRKFNDVEEMDNHMIKVWQSKVQRSDKVYVLGDFSFRKPAETNTIMNKLPGQKFLVKGNHDHKKELKKIQGWDWVQPYHELKHDNEFVILSHYPFEVWRDSHHGSWHLHGHSHGTLPPKGRRMDVGVDAIGTSEVLISFDSVREKLIPIPVYQSDYHRCKKPDFGIDPKAEVIVDQLFAEASEKYTLQERWLQSKYR